MSRVFTTAEVAKHATEDDCYMIIHGKVYDATSYMNKHPGGSDLLVEVGGQDATEAFDDNKHSAKAKEILEGLLVGTVAIPPAATTKKASKRQMGSSHTKIIGSDTITVIALLVSILSALAAWYLL